MAKISYGATVQVNDGVSSAYTAFDSVTNITPPAPEEGEVETTHLLSASRTKTYVAGLVEPGEFTFEQNYSASEYTRLVNLTGTSKSFKVIFPDTDCTCTFAGHVKKVEAHLEGPESLIKISTTVKVDGAVTVA